MEEQQVIKILFALAQKTRLRIFRRLVRCGTEELSAGVLAEELELAAATLSFHLKELSSAGLVNRRRAGRHILYSLDNGCMKAFLGHLMHDCCEGRPELCEPFLEYSGEQTLQKPRT